MESIISTFHIDWKIIIAQAVNFGVVFIVLYIFALKPLNKLMAERSEKIKKGVDDAKSNATLLEQTKKEQEEILAKARVEANKIFQEGKKDLEKARAENSEKIKMENEEAKKNRIKQLEADKKILVDSAKHEIISLAMLAAEKVITDKNKQNK